MNRTDRLLGLLLELQRRKRVRAEDLAAHFETSKRTIYRDIQALCETGVPIVAQAGIGYSLVEGYFLPPLSFTADEATMLLLGNAFAAQKFDAQFCAAAATAKQKIEAVLSEKLRDEVEYLQNSIALVAPDLLNHSAMAQNLAQLRRAIIERKTVRFRYHTRYKKNGNAAYNTRENDPYGLVNYSHAWYLIGFCHLRQEIRHFKLDRINDCALLEQSFQRPANFKMEPPSENDRDITVKILFDGEAAPWVRESRSFYITSCADTPYGLLVTLKIHTEEQILSWLLSWGWRARVIEPESLRKAVALEAKKIVQNYSLQKQLKKNNA